MIGNKVIILVWRSLLVVFTAAAFIFLQVFRSIKFLFTVFCSRLPFPCYGSPTLSFLPGMTDYISKAFHRSLANEIAAKSVILMS